MAVVVEESLLGDVDFSTSKVGIILGLVNCGTFLFSVLIILNILPIFFQCSTLDNVCLLRLIPTPPSPSGQF